MKKRFYRIFLGLLGVLGLTGCLKHMTLLYGPAPLHPHKVKGRITDEKGNPINGIKILSDVDTYIPIDPDTDNPVIDEIDMAQAKSSKEDGSYEISADYFMSRLFYIDIDGEENGGSFECTTVDIGREEFNNPVSTVDVTMKKIAGEDAGDENTPESEE